MDINLDKGTLNRFSFLMSFYEHADQLKQDGIIKRKIVSPTFASEKTLKERLSRVMLKGLRSSTVYDSGEEIVTEDATVKVKSITRRLNRDFELERYMQFVLELQTSSANDDIIPMVNNTYELYHLEDKNIKRRVIASLIPFANNGEFLGILNSDLVNYLMDNYEVCSVKDVVDRRTLVYNPLTGIRTPDSDHLSVNYRDCRFNKLQNNIFEIGSYHFSRNGPMILTKLMDNMFNGRSDFTNTLKDCNYNSGVVGTPIKEGDVADWDKHFTSNFYIPINSGWGRQDDEASGTLVFCKKILGPDNAYTITPNLVESINRYDLVFSKESITTPNLFYTLNKDLMANIRSHILGE